MNKQIEIDFIEIKKQGFALRQTLAISSYLKVPVKIINFRKNEDPEGMRWRDILYGGVIANIGNLDVKGFEKKSTELEITPKEIVSGNKIVKVKNTISISEIILPAALVCLGEKTRIRFIGPTDFDNLTPPEFIKYSTFSYLEKMGLKYDLDIINKGFEEEGSLILTNNSTALPKNYKVKTSGDLDAIKAHICTTGYKTHVNDEIYSYARQRLLQTGRKIKFILEENKYLENQARNKGASMALVAYYDNITLCGCASGVKKTVPLIGKEAGDKIVGYLSKDFSIDSENAASLLPFFCITKESEFVINKISDKFSCAKIVCEKLFNKKIDFDKDTRVVRIY